MRIRSGYLDKDKGDSYIRAVNLYHQVFITSIGREKPLSGQLLRVWLNHVFFAVHHNVS